MSLWYRNPKVIIFTPLLLILAFIIACGGAATPTPAPQPTAALTGTTAPAPQPTAALTGTTAPVPTAAPTPTTAPPAVEKPEGTFNVGFKELGIFSASPNLTAGQQKVFVGVTVMESLVSIDIDGGFFPKLAKEWSVSPDGLVWTLKLEEGVQYHKGYGEMTAEDVVWAHQEAGADGSVSAGAPQLRRTWRNEEGWVKAVDDYTIELHTGQPQYDVLILVGRAPYVALVSKKQVDELGAEAASNNGAGTGPWEIVETQPGVSWTFDAVEGHWRKTPNFAQMVFHEIPEESTRLANFQVGNLDTFKMAFDSLPAVEKIPDTKFMRVVGGGIEHLGFMGNWYVGVGTDEQRPGFDPTLPWVSGNPDPSSPEWDQARKVRLALSIGINRQLIVDTLLGGQGQPGIMWGWEFQHQRLDPDIQAGWEYNPERSKVLLAEAGYPDGFEMTVTASVRGVPAEVEACEAIATMWEDIGIRTRVQRVPYGTLSPQIRSRTYNQAHCHGTGGRFEPLYLLSSVYPSTGGFTVGFDHPLVDEWLKEAVRTVDEEERYKILNKIARFVYDNVLEVGLYSSDFLWPLSPRIDEWTKYLEYGDRRALSGTEYTPHRQ